jgi:AcrR family transcriptional regulator
MSRKQQIADAAWRLFRRFGYRKTTVGEIAAEAGIGKGSVYLEFPSKEDVFFALVEEHERGLFEEVRKAALGARPLEERLLQIALIRPRRNAAVMAEFPEVFEVLASLRGRLADRVRPFQEQCVDVVADLIRQGCEEGCFRVVDPAGTARPFYRAFDVSFVLAMHGMPLPQIERELTHLARLLIAGLRTAPDAGGAW